ncbi:RES family NAD+ phosphorylase [Mucilaginibacter sp. dw_454]|uniref:RES family NAD+ phosphorylase n=1 Tax=Mucilaginibacter sp. dw_454 TaxID=2720079 RepID=UPI001BD1C3A1|nr:RES family NAD+ phosphorylase [Mucilaginibacter sp. dw_454]
MLLYRITRKDFADLSGTGSRLYGGRWNSEGKAAVYLASSRSLAMLEALAHLSPTNVPDDLCLMVVDVPENYVELDLKLLPNTWERYDDQYALKQIGNNFLLKKEKLLLKVPSALVKQEFNFLFNPLHPKAGEAKIISTEPFAFDSRLT